MALKENLVAAAASSAASSSTSDAVFSLKAQLAKSENEAIIQKHDLQQYASREAELREIIIDLRSTMDVMSSEKRVGVDAKVDAPAPSASSASDPFVAEKIESLEAANRKLGNLHRDFYAREIALEATIKEKDEEITSAQMQRDACAAEMKRIAQGLCELMVGVQNGSLDLPLGADNGASDFQAPVEEGYFEEDDDEDNGD